MMTYETVVCDLFTFSKSQVSLVVRSRSLAKHHLYLQEMSEIDDVLSSASSQDSSDETETSDSDEMEVVGLVQPYEGEPRALSSDDSDVSDNDADQDGLSPAVLRSRFEGNVLVSEW